MDRPTQLTTDRLVLRPFTPEDVEDLLEYTQDPEWARYQVNIKPVPLSRQDAETLVAMFSDPANWETLQIFAITMDGKVIGEVAVNQRDEDRLNERAELVYTLSREHWGKGFMTEAARAVMHWAFRTYSFNRLFAYCDPRNVGSRRVLEKLGMKYEGQLRNHLKWNGEFRDQVYFGILRAEWESLTDSNTGT